MPSMHSTLWSISSTTALSLFKFEDKVSLHCLSDSHPTASVSPSQDGRYASPHPASFLTLQSLP